MLGLAMVFVVMDIAKSYKIVDGVLTSVLVMLLMVKFENFSWIVR